MDSSGHVASRVVDSDSGPGFSVYWVDVNNDGKLDLLATNHLNQNGSVFAYTWQGDLRDNNTVVHKHVLASGFSAVTTKTGTASPGDVVAFTPRNGSKPFVFVLATMTIRSTCWCLTMSLVQT